ncbi:MAG: hypothetical protein JNM60_11455 [Candidatus Competibacteraceae bacterium]|nr:hypothetical protein [Candidatus Competibacteraceae bacterium]
MDGLLKVGGCDRPDRAADVIFVHGLDGDARTTWHPKDRPDAFWPAWLADDVPAAGVWSLGYAVSASAWKGHAMPLADRATNALQQLKLDKIGRRPVVFVCHSLGGLLVKQMLRNASDFGNPAWKAIATQTRAIVFLSTPHSGADLASWIKYIGGLLRTTVSVEDLEAHHPRLRELNLWHRNHVADFDLTTEVYYEKRPVAGILVVNETTADPGIVGVVPVPVDEDHVSICKPTSKDSLIYRSVKCLIEDIVNAARSPAAKPPPKDHVADSQPSAKAPADPNFGPMKIDLCRRLGADWQNLADYFEIAPAERARFDRGWEPQRVWEWLESRGELATLAEGLRYIGRNDLAALLDRPQ